MKSNIFNRLTASTKEVIAFGVVTALSLVSMTQTAHARLIFTTEDEGVNADAYHLDYDDTSADFIDLAFGSGIGSMIRYDILNTKFIINQNLDLAGNEFLNFIVENQTDANEPTCDAAAAGRMYYNTTNNTLLFCNGTSWVNTESDLTGLAGDGLVDGGGGALDVNVDDSTIEINADVVRVKDGGITTEKILDGTIATADIAAGAITGGLAGVIADGSITADDLGTDSVGSAEIATDAVGSDEIAADAVTASEIATGAVTTTEILDGTISTTDMASGGNDKLFSTDAAGNVTWIDKSTIGVPTLTSGQMIVGDAAGDATAVTITGDATISNTGVLTLATDSVGSDEIATDAVGSDEIAADAVTASEIATDAVGSDEIATGAVTTAEISDGTIATADIAAGAITGGLNGVIADGSITSDDLAADSVTASEIATGAVGSDEIATDAVTASEIATDAVGSDEIAANAVTASEIATGAVTTTEILDGTIATADIAAGAITGGLTGVIADDSITADDLAIDSVTASEIATDAVDSDEIAADAVTASEIATDAVGSDEIAADAVTASEIATGAVTTDEILDDTITLADIAARSYTQTISPEFPEFTIQADGSDNSGRLLSDHDSTNHKNYYEWSTKKTTEQDYDLLVQWTIPEGFQSFNANSLSFDYKTTTTAAADGEITLVEAFDTAGATIAGVTTNSGASTTWASISNIDLTGAGTLTVGEPITLRFRMKSRATAGGDRQPSQLGAIELQYNIK